MADDWAAGGESDDEDIRIAIALSLGQEPPARTRHRPNGNTVDLTQSDDDETVSPHAASWSQQAGGNQAGSAPPTQAGPSSLGIAGMDRRKMEEEEKK